MSFTRQTIGNIEGLADAAKSVLEGKINVYELAASLTDEDASGFISAALAAKEEGKDKFMFNGKEYPVTVGEDVAKQIEAKLDPVGKEDDDVDNDGDVDDSDEYLKKRRDAIDKAMDEEDETLSLIDTIKKGAHVAEKAYKSKDEAIDPKIYTSNDEIAPETKTGVPGEDDIEETDGEEIEAEGPQEFKAPIKVEGFTDEEVRALCHSKDHDCATVIEHPEFGLGKPVHGSHAIPDDNGFVEWYDVEFKHGVEEKVYAKDVKVLASEDHMKEEEDDGIDGAKPIDKDVKKNVTTSKVAEPKGGDAKAEDIDDEDDGIEGSAPVSKESVESFDDVWGLIENLRPKNPNKTSTIDIDIVNPGKAMGVMKKFGLKAGKPRKMGGATGVEITGKNKDLLAYLTSKDYDMDKEDIKDLFGKDILESLDIDEGKMKELHALVSKGIKDPKKIAKELGLKPSKDTFDAISSIIAGM